MNTWLLIPCQRARIDLLSATVASLQHPRDRVVVVTTFPDPIRASDVAEFTSNLLVQPDRGQRISAWWNAGIDYIRDATSADEYDIAAVSSDCAGTPDSIPVLRDFLRSDGLIMAGPNYHSNQPRIFTAADRRTVHDRVPGACWMIRGETGLRVDEDFRWWYADDDFEMQARQLGPVGIIPGTGFDPLPDSYLSETVAVWAQEDRQKFVDKWNTQPW